ncbi:alginate O-acetyltransferase [Pedobacter psychrophilus]|uniref:Alginate O-acetyltransferase n=2 Tax=Pedobacter psychrophilus TaxID=1826909 RepID=A0A179DEU1_9SPHI|nr:alginate O-acetyltransferase [Pedobacter psychrophilus]
MLFNSFHFLFFFLIVTSLYFTISHKWRWILLLASSCYFYMAFVPIYILILGITIVIDYFAGICIENAKGKQRKVFLIVSLIANISVLCIFKYFNFLNDNFSFLMHGFGLSNPIPYLSILLPIGLSFHTFQAMSYTIEVYRGNQKAEKHFGVYSLYVMFYPQLVAGPIERPQNLLHQFREKHNFEYFRIVEGLKLILWGFFKKLVVADRLALYVNAVYNNAEHHSGFSFFVATVFFAFQIYCDFSAYSDIAIGVAKVMGFHLMTNFNRPYFARNVAEFWKRWHISLSTWFKDYLYISLGGNKVSIPKWYFNLFLVFFISGLWHGANWTYIIWGALNGFYLIFANISSPAREKFNAFIGLNNIPVLSRCVQIIVTFMLICFAWIFFRANNVDDAFIIIKKISTLNGPLFIENPSKMIYCLVSIGLLFIIEYKREYYKGNVSFFNSKNWIIRNISYASLVIIILLFGVFDGGQFIYFQF